MLSEKVAVVGGGLMGHAIAFQFARAGFDVAVYDERAEARASLPDRIDATAASTGLEERARADIRARVHSVADVRTAVDGVVFVTEAIAEELQAKRAIFASLVASAPEEAVLASNTSVIPISQIADGLERPERVVGTHWWNPPHLISLVEVVRGERTSEDTMNRTCEMLRAVGKSPARVEKDIPGFVGNRLQHALWREAINLVERGVCDADTVDMVVTSSFGRRLAVLGPLANADLVGTDLTLAIHEQVLYDLDDRHGPSPYLRALVEDGALGMKTGRGFFSWPDGASEQTRERLSAHLQGGAN